MGNINYKRWNNGHKKTKIYSYWSYEDFCIDPKKRFDVIADYSDDPDIRAELINKELRKKEDTNY